MKKRLCMAASCLLFFLLASTDAFSGENCNSLGGTCRDTCGHNEEQGIGAFEDCTERQQCCVAGESGPLRLQCCVFSFDAKKFGASNCGLPENNTCSKGSGHPGPCLTLIFCK